MLKIENLEASYDSLKVLKGVNIEVNKGDLAVIIGPNGSGKSTVIKSIFGLLNINSGKIMLNNKNITGKRPDEVIKLGIAYVPQGARVFRTMTVEENLEMGAFILNDKALINERIEEIYKYFPILKEKKNQLATFLSGGQQQMLSMGRALMLKPDLLLLDEPSAGLAPNMMQEIFKKIKDINKKGTTVVLVEQNARFALQICTKAFILESGKVALKGGPELKNSTLVKDLYLGH